MASGHWPGKPEEELSSLLLFTGHWPLLERLGVVIETVRDFSGVGGGRVRAEFGIVDLELVSLDRRTSYRWSAWVGFCRRDRVLWGHLGFLDHFTASFDGEGKRVSLRPNRTMPGR